MRLEPCDAIYVSTSTATTVVTDRPCIVQNVILSPGSAASGILLIDPVVGTLLSTSGTTKLYLHGVASGASISYNGSGSGIAFNNGCIAVITGTGAQATIVFADI
jgi:hypothetical protein